MLIDKYLIKFDFNEVHQIVINGSPNTTTRLCTAVAHTEAESYKNLKSDKFFDSPDL